MMTKRRVCDFILCVATGSLIWACGSNGTVSPSSGDGGAGGGDSSVGPTDAGPMGVDANKTDGSGADATTPVGDGGSSFPVSVTVNGLTGTLGLQLSPTNTLSVTAPGTYPFPANLPNGETYRVAVSAQPGQPEYCGLTNATGTITSAPANVTARCQVAVSCAQILALIPTAPSGTYSILPPTDAGTAITVNCDMVTNNGGWTQVFDQTVGNYMNPVSGWILVNPTTYTQGKYSILEYMAEIKSQTNYEFQIRWPQISGSVWWQQVENPITNPNPVTVSNLIEVPPNQADGTILFAGLSTSTGNGTNTNQNAFLAGERTPNGDYWAIGTIQLLDGGIPTYMTPGNDAGIANNAVNETQLWLR